jgi:hypothetical protein
MVSIREVLELDRWPDLVVHTYGFEARHRPDIAPLAYDISINNPPRAETIEKIVSYAGNADKLLTRDLFSLCNGLRVGATRFSVYGIPVQGVRFPPLDIDIPNIYGRVASWSEDDLIVGTSTEGTRSAAMKMMHAITPDGRIVVALESDASVVHREYARVRDWLAAEVERAVSDTTRF